MEQVMTTNSNSSHTKQTILDDLTAIRDQARLRIHLLSLDARDRWAEFETRIDGLERTLKDGNGKLSGASKHVEELRRATTEFLADFPYAPGFGVAVSKIMTRDVKFCHPTDSLAHAASLLWDENLGVLPVVSDDGHVLGMLTDRDICMAAYTQGATLHDLPVSIAMSRTVHACSVDDTLEGVADVVERHKVRRLPVLSAEGYLVGIVTLGDMSRFAATLPNSELVNRVILCLLANVTDSRNSAMSTAA
jgi:CBS domain-containing protein